MAEQLNVILSKVDFFEFADGDTGMDVQEDILNEDVFFLQTLSKPVNDHRMEILLFADAMKRGSKAKSFT